MVSISNEGADGDSGGEPAPGDPAGPRPGPTADRAAHPSPGPSADSSPDAPADPIADALLDAAYASIATFGLRRLTLTDVARRAGVSRPTIYRRWRDIDTLLGDLLTREMRTVLLAAVPRATAEGHDARTRLVAGAACVLEGLRAHPLMARILDTEPETLVTYTFQRLGSSQRDALAFTEEQIRAGQTDGSIRAGEPAELARLVLLLVQTAAQSWRLVDDVLPLAQLTREVRHMLDAYLSPQPGEPA
ncbi:TetR/AcrR family transcriptional regulator [Streptomyces sp. JJ66]|uniref:TetR/AcrR family transcriptional regulator n=1 Tax=Streptomyces sp. JJ66 TaxID=2803843 RepID=UPI001C584BAF|nr:TetR/AcrR family transcriptional regulator [Streptomyces sp. JJ66]MBW1601543.1 TetR/AcrR family transcriptional regulator [Streptomyces sp. JJ66]